MDRCFAWWILGPLLQGTGKNNLKLYSFFNLYQVPLRSGTKPCSFVVWTVLYIIANCSWLINGEVHGALFTCSLNKSWLNSISLSTLQDCLDMYVNKNIFHKMQSTAFNGFLDLRKFQHLLSNCQPLDILCCWWEKCWWFKRSLNALRLLLVVEKITGTIYW